MKYKILSFFIGIIVGGIIMFGYGKIFSSDTSSGSPSGFPNTGSGRFMDNEDGRERFGSGQFMNSGTGSESFSGRFEERGFDRNSASGARFEGGTGSNFVEETNNELPTELEE